MKFAFRKVGSSTLHVFFRSLTPSFETSVYEPSAANTIQWRILYWCLCEHWKITFEKLNINISFQIFDLTIICLNDYFYGGKKMQ